jgi:3-hydroxyisobutyryl-CoA hydrolase
MPETAIGFFADVGGSYFLPRLKDNIGIFLVLTGNRLKGKDVKLTGIATHYLDSTKLANLERELFDSTELNAQQVDNILSKFNEGLSGEFDSSKIARNFTESSLEKIYANLEKENSEWSKQQLKLLNKMSPTALKIAIRQLEEGSKKSLKECLEMEYQLCHRFTSANDFFEGVRCVLIDKGDKPQWKPQAYKEVTNEMVDWYFNPLKSDDKLILQEYSKL